MESGLKACDICGCTQTNLIDGFYYCAECGTQDANVRETLIEAVVLGDGVLGMGVRKGIKQIPQANAAEMTDDWYKWHSLNFLLHGLANELVELGAEPSFKTKLLWVWTRYMKKYQNKADFGLTSNEEKVENEEKLNNEENTENLSMGEDYFTFDGEFQEEITKTYKQREKPNVKKINMSLVITLLYVALNLDKSSLQLTHLIRFITEGRLSVMHWQKFVPKELHPKKLYFCLLFNKNWFIYSYRTILSLAMQLFKELDLGNPIVPDIRLLVDQYMQELCLPNDMKPLVLSLMHFRSYDYLDMNVKFYETGRIPSYELYVISHILCAMKICFGIDGKYENTISDAVDKINEIENHPKSYNSEPTKRLFSFREWLKYIQFRKSILWSHSLYLGAPNYSDMNDYVAFEHLSEKPDFKKTLKDEIARDIINKLPDVDINVVPKSEFPPTSTPHTTYTRVIIDHQQDPTIKQLLSEDFTQYSLRYITEDMFLVDTDSTNPKNIITGVNEQHMKEIRKKIEVFKSMELRTFDKKMVYVRDCDNHNWMITQRPKLEHVAKTSEKRNGEIDENDNRSNEPGSNENSIITEEALNDLNDIADINGEDEKIYGSDSKEKSAITEDSKVLNDLNSIIEMKIDKNKQNDEDLKIPEETENDNIFDDNFEDLDIKKEEDKDPEYNETEEMSEIPADNGIYEISDIFRHDILNQEYRTRRDSDESSEDSIHLNPESLDRNIAIKELVIHACNKYKISLPGIYICNPKRNYVRKKKYVNIERASVLGLVKQKIKGFIDDYHNQIQKDLFVQMSNMVQSAITDFNVTKEVETPMEIEEQPVDNNDNIADLNERNENELNNVETLNTLNDTQGPEINETADGKYNLFDEDSEGETHAEELLPKINPEFDEATHDISQLYIKPNDGADAPEIKLNPNVYEIIDKKIEGEEDSAPEDNKSDSEEEMSISMLQELKSLREQLTKQALQTKQKRLTPLFKTSIPSYKYWVKHYGHMLTYSIVNQRFATELDEVFPPTFKILLNECADVVGYTPYFLYKSLQRVESCIEDKYLKRKRFVPSYFEKEKRRFHKDML